MDEGAICRLFSALSLACPDPKTELVYTSPYTLLIAVMLSAQSTDKQVNIVTKSLFSIADTPHAMASLGEEAIAQHIKTLGLFRSKAKHVWQTSHILCERYHSEVPDWREALESLPGVGRKTANVVLNTAFGYPTIAVDTHIFRVCNRTGLATGRTPRTVETILEKVIPESYKKNAHHWLILHGRYTCTARSPKCETCLIQTDCAFFQAKAT